MRDPASSPHRTLLERAPLLPKGVVFALGLGAAFGLGVVVAGGIGVARGTPAPASVDVLARAKDRSKQLEDKRAQLKLSYGADLVKMDAAHLTTLPTKANAPSLTETAPAPLESAPAPMPKATSTAAEPPVEDQAPVAEKVDDRRLQQALARVLGSAPAVVAPAMVDAKATAKSWALQVASVPTEAGAESMAKKLAGARVVEGDVGGKAVFRVRVGNFADRKAAEAAKAKLAMPSFIVTE